MGNIRHCIKDNQICNFDGLKLLYVSTSKYEGDWQSILHSHPFSELFYVVRGSGSFITEGMEFPVCKNDMVIINPNVQHTEKSMRTTPLEYIVLGIEGLSFSFENIAAVQEGIFMQTAFGDVYKYNTQNSNIYAYLNIMLEEISKQQNSYETVCKNLLEVIMICMLRNNNLSIVQSNNALLNRECTQVKNYLDANYSENITLDTLASLSHMNKYYLVHAFTKYIGISPITYLIQKRIQEGKSLLESTSYSISQISSTLGFSSQSYFSQAFKKVTGKTPNQYRNEFKNS
ncbi:bifunctional transcriptional activator/DNA repair enzyme AdaA [Lachnospiraceae bacterium]|nr:bifunctional transcriptional activator/DNA repair enzyme AdaA [Lachnospiraceae bacterium]